MQLAEVMAASRPPAGSMEKAERKWRKSASWRMRLTPGETENGGFINTTLGAMAGRRSAMASALCRVTGTHPEIAAREVRRALPASSFRCKAPAVRSPSAHSAITASIPVPAEGSSTLSPGLTAAACNAA